MTVELCVFHQEQARKKKWYCLSILNVKPVMHFPQYFKILAAATASLACKSLRSLLWFTKVSGVLRNDSNAKKRKLLPNSSLCKHDLLC